MPDAAVPSPQPVPTVPRAVAAHGPYEDMGIALIGLFSKIIDGQPPEVRKQLWEMYLEDVKAWRAFWQGVGNWKIGQ